jgi:prepilin-type N-terminal cleavage/methylation domain-containing protein
MINSYRSFGAAAVRRAAFTLIELLVVIAIIGILASLLLPALAQGRQRTHITQCLNNLHQIGMGIAMFVHDNRDTFPPDLVSDTNHHPYGLIVAIGGRDPRADLTNTLPPAALRPLFPYLRPSELFRCPDDHGAYFSLGEIPWYKPTFWELTGCSYMYNVRAPLSYDLTRYGPDGDLAGNLAGWVREPSKFVLMYEPPARSFGILYNGKKTHIFQHWHYAPKVDWRILPNPNDVPQPCLPGDRYKFISPLLFVDGHVASFDFSKVIRADPDFVFEETKDWIWYKRAP